MLGKRPIKNPTQIQVAESLAKACKLKTQLKEGRVILCERCRLYFWAETKYRRICNSCNIVFNKERYSKAKINITHTKEIFKKENQKTLLKLVKEKIKDVKDEDCV